METSAALFCVLQSMWDSVVDGVFAYMQVSR